jgi:hypothetical protein
VPDTSHRRAGGATADERVRLLVQPAELKPSTISITPDQVDADQPDHGEDAVAGIGDEQSTEDDRCDAWRAPRRDQAPSEPKLMAAAISKMPVTTAQAAIT